MEAATAARTALSKSCTARFANGGARQWGTQIREVESGFRYAPTSCFKTLPLPWAPGEEPADNLYYQATAEAARGLNEKRERWLNPPEWIERIARALTPKTTSPTIRRKRAS